MHLMAGCFEAHDRERFEVFAYDYSNHGISEYRQRFLDAVEHHVPIHSLSDQQAAERIAEDRLDILFDLKLYTGGGRPASWPTDRRRCRWPIWVSPAARPAPTSTTSSRTGS